MAKIKGTDLQSQMTDFKKRVMAPEKPLDLNNPPKTKKGKGGGVVAAVDMPLEAHYRKGVMMAYTDAFKLVEENIATVKAMGETETSPLEILEYLRAQFHSSVTKAAREYEEAKEGEEVMETSLVIDTHLEYTCPHCGHASWIDVWPSEVFRCGHCDKPLKAVPSIKDKTDEFIANKALLEKDSAEPKCPFCDERIEKFSSSEYHTQWMVKGVVFEAHADCIREYLRFNFQEKQRRSR